MESAAMELAVGCQWSQLPWSWQLAAMELAAMELAAMELAAMELAAMELAAMGVGCHGSWLPWELAAMGVGCHGSWLPGPDYEAARTSGIAGRATGREGRTALGPPQVSRAMGPSCG